MSKELIYDHRAQLIKVQSYVIPGETLYAVYDLVGDEIGFVGITDLRLIFMDSQFGGRSPAMVSLPFTKIDALGCEDTSTTFETSRIQVLTTHRMWMFEFRTADKAYNAYQLIMRNLLQEEETGLL